MRPIINNRYELIDKLGQGGMGVVHKAKDRLMGQSVALKQVLIDQLDSKFASKFDTNDMSRVRLGLTKEFSILAGLRHPHIVSVLDYGVDEELHPYFTMTLMKGAHDLRSYAQNVKRDEQIRLLAQTLQAIQYLHRRGILHGDLKPENVLVTADGQVRVMDFGLAHTVDQDPLMNDDGIITGTIHYMAPELFNMEGQTVASDLYAFGIMAYELFTGHYPYTGKKIRQLITQIMTVTADCSMLPAGLAEWLGRLLSKDPSHRPANAYDVLVGLYTAVGQPIPEEHTAIRESFLQASTFVGREAETAQLTQALDTLDSSSTFFLIGGESGVGKSRLLDELRIEALVKGHTVLRGQGVEGGGLPFQLWRNVVRRLLLLVEVTDLQASIIKDIVPDVSTLLQRDIPNTLELTGRAYQNRLVSTVVDLLRNLSQPVLILLEDLQWAAESLGPLKQLLQVREQLTNLMIVGNYRTDETPTLPADLPVMTLIKLDRLDHEAVTSLSQAILGDIGASEPITQLLLNESEGNTLLILETLRALAETKGSLQRIDTESLPQTILTGGMQAMMRRRLSKVSEHYQPVQMIAAVVGREIDTKILQHVFGAEKPEQWLNNAAEYGVVDVQDNSWRFAHDKLRETLIIDMSADEKTALHRTAAESIEACYPDDDAYNEALLSHWHEAGDLDKELFYLDPVAIHMIEIQATYEQADILLERALNALPSQDPRRVSILNHLSFSLRERGRYKEAKQFANQAQLLAEQVNDQVGLATSLNYLGRVDAEQGEHETARKLYQQSMALQNQLGDQAGIALNLNNLAIIAVAEGEYETARELHQQSLAIRRKLGDQYAIAGSINNLGVVAVYNEEYETARELYQQSLTLRREIGDKSGISAILNNLAHIALATHDYETAQNLFQQSLVIQRELGAQRIIAIILHNLGLVASTTGDYETAHNLYHESLVICREIEEQFITAVVLGELGVIAMYTNDYEAAYDLLIESLAMAQPLKIVPRILDTLVNMVSVLCQKGEEKWAAQIAGFVKNHPKQDQGLRDTLDGFMPQLEAALLPSELQAAMAHGKALELGEVLEKLLGESG